MTPLNGETRTTGDPRYLLPLALADDLTEGLVVIDRESRIRYVNPAMTRIFGYGREELEGAPLTKLMPEGHRERHREALGKYLATGVRSLPWSEVELPGRHRNGDRLDLRISFSEFSQRGERLFAGTVRHLTGSGSPDEERRTMVRHYRALFADNVAAVFRAAPDGRIVAANGALARMMGYGEPAVLRGMDVKEFCGEGASRERFLSDLRERREVRNLEVRLRRVDGTLQWSLLNAVWIDDPANEKPEALVGTVVDISTRKRAERELRLSEERYQRLFEQRLVGVFRSRPGPDGEIVECNQALADMFGYESRGELIGIPAGQLYPEGEEERRETLEALREVGMFVQKELRLRRRDGSSIWVLEHSQEVEDPSGQRLIEGLLFDVTDRVQAREALERTTDKFRGVFDISPVALKILRPETDEYLDVNEHFEDIFGYGRDELLDGTVTSDDLWEDPARRRRLYDRLERGETVRNAEVRLRRRDGTIFDALFSASGLQRDGEHFLVAALQDISHLKDVERELEHQSLHDGLTGLANRALFWDRLDHALRRSRRTGQRIAVLFLDLDGFKRVNDEHGHGAGDEVLRQVARRLRSTIREADTLARLGGDEFGILLEDLADGSEAEKTARRLTERFEAPVSVAGEEALIRVSCGIAFAGDDVEEEATVTADELVHRADRAMYGAKEAPGSSFRFYGPEIKEEHTGRLRREIELKDAVANGDVVPFYQPLVDLTDGRIVGAEVLARWIHPDRGIISPGEFIPMAEETGLIADLGRQVARSACRQLSEWMEEGLLPPDFRLHLNLSARELDRPEIADVIDDLFREFGLDPTRVAFEVTESVAIESAAVLDTIRKRGSPVAVDDFGTGYATLERLTSLRLDSLKLDRSFVDRVGTSRRHEAVLEASLTLAESMELCPVAEGVETESQRSWLIEHGCRYAQGFLFAAPVRPEEFTEWIRRDERLPV